MTAHGTDFRRATEYLINADVVQLNPVLLYRQINAGFNLLDVKAMLREVAPNSEDPILRRILGISASANQRSRRQPLRLTAQQSAVAFMYAKIFELAFTVFGTRHRAELWLTQPCRDLSGDVPIEVMDNQCAFRVVEMYLQRIELGIYQ